MRLPSDVSTTPGGSLRRTLVILVTAGLMACTGQPPAWRDSALAATGEASSTAGAYLSGRFALDQGDVATAAQYFSQALAADPDNLELRRQLFFLQVSAGEFDAAIGSARELADVDPMADDALLMLALDAVRQGDFGDARNRMLRLGGRGVVGLARPILRAWVSFGAGDKAVAATLLEDGRADDGFKTLRAYHRALILGLSGQRQRAVDILSELVTDDRPSPLRMVLALAVFQTELGRRDVATALLDRQLTLLGEQIVLEDARQQIAAGATPALPVSGPAEGIADALLGLSAALNEQRATGQALIYARLASFLAPRQGDIWLLIGRIVAVQGNSEAAIAAYASTPADSPFAWEAKLARGEALRDLGRKDEAIAALQELAAERPDRTDALVTLGDLLRRDERYQEAGEAYSRAIERLPAIERVSWRLFYVRGITLERTKRWPEAEADFLKALELQPDQPLVLNYLGYSWVDQGLNLDRAKEMLHRAVELRPDDGFIVDSLGWAFFRLGEFPSAAQYLERAVELEPGDPTINDHLGDAYWRAGREREARFQWQRALTLKPEKDLIAEIERKLQNGLPATDAKRG